MIVARIAGRQMVYRNGQWFSNNSAAQEAIREMERYRQENEPTGPEPHGELGVVQYVIDRLGGYVISADDGGARAWDPDVDY